jgi:hypothetical protein
MIRIRVYAYRLDGKNEVCDQEALSCGSAITATPLQNKKTISMT